MDKLILSLQADKVYQYILLNTSTSDRLFSEPIHRISSNLKINKAHVRDALLELKHKGYLDMQRRFGATYLYYVNYQSGGKND
jgi:Mn-dependent DtxR family transcriptional regulator